MKKMSYFKKKGDSYIIFTAIGLIISLAMVVLIMAIILMKGLGFFWPGDLVQVKMINGQTYLGENWAQNDKYKLDDNGNRIEHKEIQLKIGNRDLYGLDFIWLSENEIVESDMPADAVVFERLGYGNFYGFIQSLNISNDTFQYNNITDYEKVEDAHALAVKNRDKIKSLEDEINDLNTPLSELQRELSLLQINENKTGTEQTQFEKLQKEEETLTAEIAPKYQELTAQLEKIYIENQSIYLTLNTADNQEKKLLLADVVRFYQPNDMNAFEKGWLYTKKFYEFVSAEPR